MERVKVTQMIAYTSLQRRRAVEDFLSSAALRNFSSNSFGTDNSLPKRARRTRGLHQLDVPKTSIQGNDSSEKEEDDEGLA